MEHDAQLARIQSKLQKMAALDPAEYYFAAADHHYRLHPPILEADILGFEQQFGIELPSGYKAFLLRLGNGGAGPDYGLLSLEWALVDDLDHPNRTIKLNPGAPFPHTEPWNLLEGLDEAQRWELAHENRDPKYANGLLRIANHGLGQLICLVVNGPDHGKVWVDDRENGNGFYPDHLMGNAERLEFLDWYEYWQDRWLTAVLKIQSADSEGNRALDNAPQL